MITDEKILLLQLFAEGEGSGDTPAAEGQTGETNQTPAAGENTDLDAEFAALIAKDGKYASAFKAQMQKAFNKRFAAFKETEASVQRLDSLRKAVAQRYSDVDSEDIDALTAALSSDKGSDISHEVEAMKKQVAEFMYRTEREGIINRYYDNLCRQEREMQEKYKDFNLERELGDPRFRQAALAPGNTLEDAYWHAHRSELLKKAVTDAKNAAVGSISSRKARPDEGAATASIPSTAKLDYKNMSDRDFMALYNRAVRR